MRKDVPSTDFGFDLRVLTHADLRATTRVRKLLDHTCDRLVEARGSFEGLGGEAQAP